ncbi:DegT/DnrJ/EryC1/StrS family aminotransferase [Paenibacillus qinlingensis]|uniref:DegT/DnrJ/EryC1/StrS family aminotransferase n=1 Tax=Paenibacillus qinlingensis TaxID=1837343 RepID=UPI00156682F8|nr:DegT/DnrJ/EryC1/StrS family aminotransferase [Paenibacillus qinlingensis]NQX60153.1 DegT/DnrJ/EryC1/StrS family aminotransferase [Paenibacillus qinlingensis]
MNRLAIDGGPQTKTTPFGTGRRFGLEEAQELLSALEQNTLFYHHGKKVKQFLSDFGRLYGVEHLVATSSGTAAIHVALGAAGISVGDEVITSPITDQGTLIGILYQNAIPVFADVDLRTYNLDPTSVEAMITPRTKAILAVHLAGNPCDMTALLKVAKRHNLVVIEDCAQSYLSHYKGQLTGTMGAYGCFSTNDYKHISTGDGGMVAVNTGDENDYFRAHAFADKNYQRLGNNVTRDLQYLAPNYRMTELQGAVGIAQVKKLPWICERRTMYGDRITAGINDVQGLYPPMITEESVSSYWFYMFRLDLEAFTCTRDEFSTALQAEGIPNSAGYIPDVVYMQPLFTAKQAYVRSSFPFDLTQREYHRGLCPRAETVLQTAIRLSISEFYTPEDIEEMIRAIRKVAAFYLRK